MRLRDELEKAEDRTLAPWGARSAASRGRLHPEQEHAYRTAFQRDRDRVVHSTAFRRLQYKTQVFVHHEGDHFRNRLTHTLEVAQIARTAARALGANEDLVEAIVLAHDLGHGPFGHSGERALHRLLAAQGGFEHNRQSLRVLDWLETRYPGRRGLNLCEETRAGVLKHGAEFPRYGHPVALPRLGRSPGLEAQIADLADEIAYHNHDIDDGLRSGLLELESLEELPRWREVWRRLAGIGDERVRRARAIAALIDHLTGDLIEHSTRRIERAGVASADEVQVLGERCVELSPEVAAEARALGKLLREKLYQHPQVRERAERGEALLRDLWQAYTQDPGLLPPHALAGASDEPRERAIADYLAGMTDRFAMDEHRKLFGPRAGA